MFLAKFSYYVDPVVLDKKLYVGKQNIRKAHLRDLKKPNL